MSIKSTATRLLNQLGIGVTHLSTLERLKRNEGPAHDFELLMTLPEVHAQKLINGLKTSKSQLRQDLFALSELDFKLNGFFVEFGATNGVDLSNTYLMEKSYAWTGILAEPARVWHESLKSNRTAQIETQCVWSESGKTLSFNEVEDAEFSTINVFSSHDVHATARKQGVAYPVQTISLNDLLIKHGAPKEIDYLSIDTEGSEYEILKHYDFDAHKIKVITCEHNYTEHRKDIYNLLTSNGYVRKYEALSKFDDWYIRA